MGTLAGARVGRSENYINPAGLLPEPAPAELLPPALPQFGRQGGETGQGAPQTCAEMLSLQQIKNDNILMIRITTAYSTLKEKKAF